MNPIVSVIVPVYNTEKYLEKCIQSVVRQTVNDLQIILVDDGATDSSPRICDAWAEKDKRIQVIHKKNEGLGFTRNAGLDVARGQYISFLDSDDTLDMDTYEKCIDRMEKEEADACYFGRKTMDKDGNIHLNNNIPEKLVYQGREVKAEFAKKYFGILPQENQYPYIQASACCVLYRRDVIEKDRIRFCSEREYLSEDTFFNLDICKVSKSICILPENFYNYTYNATSLTKKHSNTKFERCKKMYKKLQKYSKEFEEIADVDMRMKALFIGYTRTIVRMGIAAGGWCDFGTTYSMVKEICTDETVQEIYREFPRELCNNKMKAYLKWALNKRILLIILYYSLIKR